MYQVNLERIRKCMKKAEAGKRITIGFLGGSITQGSLASLEENTYAYRVFCWWKEAFPQAEIQYINGGIGGTNSHYGVSRALTDVLMYQPDFIIVDFSVNDEANEFFEETFEGVIRKLLSWTSEPGVLILNNVYYDTGLNAQDYHNRIGKWYQLPYVSTRDTLYQDIRAGNYTREDITSDGLHPNDRGHALVAGQVIEFLEGVRCGYGKWEDFEPWNMPEPLTKNAYEYAERLTIREISPKLNGFYTDTEEKCGHLDYFKNGWIGRKKGDKIYFEIKASCIAVQYRKTIRKPAAKAEMILDNDSVHPILLNGNFEEQWGDCQYIQPVLHHGEYKVHTIEIEIIESAEADITPFYLMSLIIAR